LPGPTAEVMAHSLPGESHAASVSTPPGPGEPPAPDPRVVELVARMGASLLRNGQTTERTVLATERLGSALGVTIRALPRWEELVLQSDGTPFFITVPATPLGVDMGKVLAIMTVIDNVCAGSSPISAASSALETAEQLPPASTARFVLFAAVGAASLGVIFGAFNGISLVLMAVGAGLGALFRRWLSKRSSNPFGQPLGAAFIAGIAGAAASRVNLLDAQGLVALCPCMVLVPGPHILNGAIDLARARVALGIARLAYAGLIVLMICTGLLAGLGIGGAMLPVNAAPISEPFGADVIAAGCAVAAFGTFFSMPWRLLPVPMAVGMVAHAARWGLISLAGAHVALGAFVACTLVGIVMTLAADRLHLPFAALAFSAVVSMMPGLFLFRAANALINLVAMGEQAPAYLLQSVVLNGTTAFLTIFAMTFGLILPRLVLVR
jgi:uncharacterized membrane protein YjjP (DUF1212 family)